LADQHREVAEVDRDMAAATTQQGALAEQIAELSETIDAIRGEDKSLRLRKARLVREIAEIKAVTTNLGE
jgi:exonuclease SbcC